MSSLVRAYRDARWGWIALAWGAVFAFDAARTILGAQLADRPLGTTWVFLDGASMAMWACYTPFMLWVVERAPFQRAGWRRAALSHGAAYLTLTLIDSIAQTLLYRGLLGSRPSIPSLFVSTLLIDGFSYATVIAIGHAQRALRQQAALDRELSRARLRALELQLQPHFLFNTLHAVGALVRADRGDDAIRCLATLGDLLRATLADDGVHEIGLADEASLARAYLDLQQIRFGDRLRVELDVAPTLAAARVPRLILQPLLENAIRHGVERSTTAIELEVRARAAGPRLQLLVRDSGGLRGAPAPGGQGIGLANTRARLDALYGRDHRFELAPTDGGGLEVRIDLPLAGAAS